MESNNLDKLFRDPLKDHEVPVSPSAWSRLEAANADKKKPAMWWMMAASLVLLFSASLYFTQEAGQGLETQVLVQERTTEKEPVLTEQERQEWLSEATGTENNMEGPKEALEKARTLSTPPPTTKTELASNDRTEKDRLTKEIAAIQTQMTKTLGSAFDPETIVVPEHLSAPKKVIESAGLQVEIYQNLTAPDSVKKAVAQQKHLLKRVLNAAMDVKNGEMELSEVLKLNKMDLPLERKNN